MEDKIFEKTVYLSRDLEKRIEEVILNNPSLNFSVIVNQALREWLNGEQTVNHLRDCFITDAPKGFGPTLKDIPENEGGTKNQVSQNHFRWRK